MHIDLTAIPLSPLAWLAVLVVLAILAFGVVRTFFHHLLHLFFRGCGLIVVVVVLLYVLHQFHLI